MTLATPHRALQYPQNSDVPDVPLHMQALATALDFDLFVITGALPAAGTLGRVHWSGTVWSFDNGTTWTTFLTAVPAGVYLLLAGGTMAGALDMGGQALKNAVVENIRDKRYSASIGAGGPTINADNGPSQSLTMTGNWTNAWTLSNFADGEAMVLELIQDAGGGRTIAFPAAWVWPGGAVARPTFVTTANAKNILYLEMRGSVVYAVLSPDWKV